ncbi:hypothetical protein C2E20_8402 [Micractinium conductrix]|uniref:Uncharacterized protein n=1 Tax=Micractinium conductrix TaxID=554055 RepID=A0A2P6V1P1_9CHLO|nr:hypothetical protein C2E20_8402 [Micractinium conductrix]|eukprot:PSC68003.1 hypothetical protein C2E20_8402 [Micractinium conductrix]
MRELFSALQRRQGIDAGVAQPHPAPAATAPRRPPPPQHSLQPVLGPAEASPPLLQASAPSPFHYTDERAVALQPALGLALLAPVQPCVSPAGEASYEDVVTTVSSPLQSYSSTTRLAVAGEDIRSFLGSQSCSVQASGLVAQPAVGASAADDVVLQWGGAAAPQPQLGRSCAPLPAGRLNLKRCSEELSAPPLQSSAAQPDAHPASVNWWELAPDARRPRLSFQDGSRPAPPHAADAALSSFFQATAAAPVQPHAPAAAPLQHHRGTPPPTSAAPPQPALPAQAQQQLAQQRQQAQQQLEDEYWGALAAAELLEGGAASAELDADSVAAMGDLLDIELAAALASPACWP